MTKKDITTITGKMIEIKDSLPRHEIVKKVVNTFIETEYHNKGKGVIFRYPVENLPDGQLFIVRPGYKKNFDFKVDIPLEITLGKERQKEIAFDLRKKNLTNPRKFKAFLQAIAEIYHCRENDVNVVLRKYRALRTPFKTGLKVESLLKIIKWLFIMEDIIYWDSQGRAFLYNFLRYAASETDVDRFDEALTKKVEKDPNRLKRFMKKAGVEWVPYTPGIL